MKPSIRPADPNFSSGPCAKRPGWSPDILSNALLGRSHRSTEGKARLAEVIDAPEQRPFDRPLRLLSRGLQTLLSVEDAGDRAFLHAVMAENADLLLVRGGTPGARRARSLQLHFFRSVAQLLEMEDYGGTGPGPGPEDDGPDGPGPAA